MKFFTRYTQILGVFGCSMILGCLSSTGEYLLYWKEKLSLWFNKRKFVMLSILDDSIIVKRMTMDMQNDVSISGSRYFGGYSVKKGGRISDLLVERTESLHSSLLVYFFLFLWLFLFLKLSNLHCL